MHSRMVRTAEAIRCSLIRRSSGEALSLLMVDLAAVMRVWTGKEVTAYRASPARCDLLQSGQDLWDALGGNHGRWGAGRRALAG